MHGMLKSRCECPSPSRHQEKIAARCRAIKDLRAASRKRLPKSVFDFIDGGADDERTLQANADAFSSLRFRATPLVDVSDISTQIEILGRAAAAPIVIAPFGAAGFPWPLGDIAVADSAALHDIPYAMSSTASATLEQIAERQIPRRWFQCYIFKRREITRQLIERAERLDYETLIITVDLPVGGNRERDYRNDFAVPFRFTARNVLDFARHPAWTLATLSHGMPTLANLSAFGSLNHVNTVASTVGRNYDPSFNWDDLARIRDAWPKKLVIKGITRGEDAERLAALGVDAVSVSNHGGRQLDSALPALYCLPEVRAAVGKDMTVFMDGGIRRGSDIVKALALGANAVMVGRAVLFGLGAAGAAGTHRALDILIQELRRTMQLLGVTDPRHLDAHVIAKKDLQNQFVPAIARQLLNDGGEPPHSSAEGCMEIKAIGEKR